MGPAHREERYDLPGKGFNRFKNIREVTNTKKNARDGILDKKCDAQTVDFC